jgi:YggT family protein
MLIVITVVQWASMIYSLLIIARALLSFVPIDPYHPIAQFLHRVTEPALAPIRGILPPTGPFDFSPLIALLLLNVLTQLVVGLLWSLGHV